MSPSSAALPFKKSAVQLAAVREPSINWSASFSSKALLILFWENQTAPLCGSPVHVACGRPAALQHSLRYFSENLLPLSLKFHTLPQLPEPLPGNLQLRAAGCSKHRSTGPRARSPQLSRLAGLAHSLDPFSTPLRAPDHAPAKAAWQYTNRAQSCEWRVEKNKYCVVRRDLLRG